GVLVHDQGLFKVDNMDLVAMAEDIRGHLGVPEARLVAKVHTGFQHFTHGYGHGVLQGLGSCTASGSKASRLSDTLGVRRADTPLPPTLLDMRPHSRHRI